MLQQEPEQEEEEQAEEEQEEEEEEEEEEQEEEEQDAKTTYTIEVKTSDGYRNAKTGCKVEIRLIGEKEDERVFDERKYRTEWHKIIQDGDNANYGTGCVDINVVEMKDVGMPCIVQLKISKRKVSVIEEDAWLCDYVKIEQGDLKKTFPVYAFLNPSKESKESKEPKATVSLIAADTQLKENLTNHQVIRYRRENLDKMKELVQWAPKPAEDQEEPKEGEEKPFTAASGVMRFTNAATYRDLPKIMKKYTNRQRDFVQNIFTGVGAAGLAASKHPDPATLEEFHQYHKLLDNIASHEKLDTFADPPEDDFLDDWKSDESFGWQILNGMLPFGFKLCKEEIPQHFCVTDEDLEGLLGSGKTIQSEIQAEKLYITDYSEIYAEESGLEYTKILPEGRCQNENCQVAAPMCLFYSGEQFLPLAIQLQPNDREYLFIAPKSGEKQTESGEEETFDWKWLLAKMYFRNASFSIHEWIYHFTYTHATVEPFQVAAYRCLSQAHPIYKLLRPHIRTVAAINAGARTNLIPRDSIPAKGISVDAQSMVKLFYKTFNLDKLYVPEVLKNNGIVPEKIPSYHYGHDTLELWNIVRIYVEAVIKLFYHSDQDVEKDSELKHFAHEVACDGFGWEDGNTRGMPEHIKTKKELARICTLVICTSSVQHAAVNFGQYESGKYVPNFPSIMNQPPHKNTCEIDEKKIVECLPKPSQFFGVTAILYALSSYSRDERYLGDFKDEEWFFEETVKKEQRNLCDNLAALEVTINERNNAITDPKTRPYTHQLPSRIPNSIAI